MAGLQLRTQDLDVFDSLFDAEDLDPVHEIDFVCPDGVGAIALLIA